MIDRKAVAVWEDELIELRRVKAAYDGVVNKLREDHAMLTGLAYEGMRADERHRMPGLASGYLREADGVRRALRALGASTKEDV